MCGIAGFTGERDPQLIREMTRALGHRGPDGEGYYESDHIQFGHKRLAIIDLSTAGDQPLFNEDRSMAVICNGEVFNYLELRAELEGLGHRFHSHSDSETIVHGYEEWGIGVLSRLNGMYAIALWDSNQKRLILARDRMGVKPLYYVISEGRLYFASEYKSFRTIPGLSRTLSHEAMNDYFACRYIPGEASLISEYKRLPPAHFLVFENGHQTLERYWHPSQSQIEVPTSREVAIETFEDLLTDAVKIRLRSDVKVSLTLSGGVDSTLLLAKIAQLGADNISLYHFGFDDFSYSEENVAQSVASHFGMSMETLKYEATDPDQLIESVWIHDDPWGDSTQIPFLTLNRHLKSSATVQLTGSGADEIFGGYVHHQAMRWNELATQLAPADSLRGQMLTKITQAAPSSLWEAGFNYPSKLGSAGTKRIQSLFQGDRSRATAFSAFSRLFSRDELRSLLAPDVYMPRTHYDEQISKTFGSENGLLNQILEHELNFYLPEMSCRGLDRQSMASGVEARTPFLDYRLVEYAWKAPSALKLTLFQNKILLREVLKKYVPRHLAKRKKQGFHFPLENYFKRKDFREIAGDYLSMERIRRRGILNVQAVEDLKAQFNESPFLASKRLFSLLVFEIWCSLHLDGDRGIS